MDKQDQNCETCFKIKCKNCGWEPNEEEIVEVQKGTLTNCPACGKGKKC